VDFQSVSLLVREVNFQQNPYNTYHHTFSVLPHYLAKFKVRICGNFLKKISVKIVSHLTKTKTFLVPAHTHKTTLASHHHQAVQSSLVPAKWRRCSASRKVSVSLAMHHKHPPTGYMAYEKEMSTLAMLCMSITLFTQLIKSVKTYTIYKEVKSTM